MAIKVQSGNGSSMPAVHPVVPVSNPTVFDNIASHADKDYLSTRPCIVCLPRIYIVLLNNAPVLHITRLLLLYSRIQH